jgi:hypothetical protein
LVFMIISGKPKGLTMIGATSGVPWMRPIISVGSESAKWYCPASRPSTRVVAFGTGTKRTSPILATRWPP